MKNMTEEQLMALYLEGEESALEEIEAMLASETPAEDELLEFSDAQVAEDEVFTDVTNGSDSSDA